MTTHPEWFHILGEGEDIIWQGQPKPGMIIRKADYLAVAAGFGIIAFTFYENWSGGGGWQLSAFQIVFMLMFLVFFLGRYPFEAYLRRHTFYSLSNRRAFIARDLPLRGRKLESYPITPDSPIERASHDTVFFKQIKRSKGGAKRIGFVNVDNPEAAYAKLLEVQQRATELAENSRAWHSKQATSP